MRLIPSFSTKDKALNLEFILKMFSLFLYQNFVIVESQNTTFFLHTLEGKAQRCIRVYLTAQSVILRKKL